MTETAEYHLDPTLEEMANTIKGQKDRFIRLEVKFGSKKPRAFEFAGDSEQLIDKLTDVVRRGGAKVITQSIGTYTEGSSSQDSYKK